MMMKRCRGRILLPAAAEVSSNSYRQFHLPPELLLDILARLPLKALLRFRCVCKTWCSLVEDPEFVSMHLEMSLTNHSQQYLSSDRPLFAYRQERRLDTDMQYFESWSNDVSTKLSEFTLPWKTTNARDHIKVKIYVHGLLLLYIVRVTCVPVHEIKLWNPSIRRSLDLPLPLGFNPSQEPLERKQFMQLELGYDPVTKDYKVLAFIRGVLPLYMLVKDLPSYARFLINPSTDPEDSKRCFPSPAFVQVYTVGTGVWRNITLLKGQYSSDDDKGCFWWYLKCSAYLNGVIYWIGLDSRIRDFDSRLKSPRIVSFDMGSEVFGWTMKLPTEQERVVSIRMNVLGVMGESLVFMKRFEAHISIWLMDLHTSSIPVKDHPWSLSWTIDVQPIMIYAYLPCIMMTNSGLLLDFRSRYRNTCYDVKCRQLRNHYRGVGGRSILGDYVESLALLKKGNAFEVT